MTSRTTQIQAFVDFVDLDDYKKSEGIPNNNNLTITLSSSSGSAYYVNDFQNNTGIIRQIKSGDIGPKGFTPGNYEGNFYVYLGEYYITPSLTRSFNGGAIIQFNFSVTSGTGQNTTFTYIYATAVVPVN